MLNLKFRSIFARFSMGLIVLLGLNVSLAGLVEAAPTPPPTAAPIVISPTKAKTAVATTPSRPAATAKPTPTIPQPKLVTKPPTVTAAGAIAVDADTGRILYLKDAHRQLPMASTTKIMTALTLLSTPGIDLNSETTVVQDDLVGEANMNLRNGEHIKLLTLLVGLLTNSANEAGMALARYVGSKVAGPADPVSRFVALMNAKALSLGMYDSHYMNPHGLDEAGHYSSAYDLAISGWYALRYPTITSIIRLDTYNYGGHDFYNVNNFIRRYPGATGIKPGLTDEAGRCLIASATNYGHTVIVVVLNDDNLTAEVDNLMDYSFSLLTNRAQPQQSLYGPAAYIGLPSGNRLLPFDIKPILEILRWAGTYSAQLLKALRTPK